jgi:hypothetical protein
MVEQVKKLGPSPLRGTQKLPPKKELETVIETSPT